VPFVRCTRDKRGYEHIYLMHASAGRRGKPSKPRILYWFRTPPGVKVGREPFDESVRRTLEAQNPGVVFDWKKLSVIPQAPVDVEYWREKRRAERAAKQARRAEEAAEPGSTDANVEEEEQLLEPPELTSEVPAEEPLASASQDSDAEQEGDDEEGLESAPPNEAAPSAAGSAAPGAPGGARRRRRRGGRRRRRKPGNVTPGSGQIQVAEAATPSAAIEPAQTPETPQEPSKEE